MPEVKTKLAFSWHHHKLGIPALWSSGQTGKGVRVAVLDSGLARLPELDGPRTEYLDEQGQPIGAIDVNGHGTACTSLIASRRNGALGVARDAAISSYRVTDSGDLAAKIERAFAAIVARPDIDVVLCAFVIDRVTPGIMTGVRVLAQRGTVVVASAGNDKEAAAEYPQLTPHALTIAGTTDQDVALPDAQTGVWIDVAAPGAKLRALGADGRELELSGTSGAAALVAGVAALLLGTQSSPAKRRQVGQLFEGMARASASQLPNAAPNTVGRGLVNPAGILKLINEGV